MTFPASCTLCPRACRADRSARPGFCGETASLRIATHTLHFGEEPPLSGTRGSGAFFFSGCPCHCFFCQNAQISRPGGLGSPVSPDELHAMALDLAARGAHNLNFVTPDHVWPHIATLCRRLRAEGFPLPFVFNSSGYHAPSLLDEAIPLMDIFLPDFKFADAALAARVMGDARYPEIALAAIERILAAKGCLEPFDPTGKETARTGLLVRHLVLPGHVRNSLDALSLLRDRCGRFLPLSIMSQYTPPPSLGPLPPPFDRTLAPGEYQTVVDRALDLGFENLFVQPLADPSAPDPYTPDFASTSPFPAPPSP